MVRAPGLGPAASVVMMDARTGKGHRDGGTERPDASRPEGRGTRFGEGRGATAIAPYSTRARIGATVATPLTWDELARGVKPSELNIYTVMRRLGEQGDPWKDYGKVRQALRAPALRVLGIRS